MAPPVPGFVLWSAIGYVGFVAAARLLFVRASTVDRLVNCLPLCGLVGLLLYRFAPTPDISEVMTQLALGCVVLLGMFLYGLGRLWESDTDSELTWRRQRIYCTVAAAATAVFLVAGPSAGAVGRLADQQLNWGGIAVWAAFGIPQLGTALLMFRLCRHELVSARTRPSTKVLCLFILFALVPFGADLVLGAGEIALGWDVPYPHIVRVEIIFVCTAVLTSTLAGTRMIDSLLAYAEWDRDGRICRRLRPLWRDVTAAVPEIVLAPDPADGSDGTARLLRTMVEIRDALLHLSPYLPPVETADEGSPSDCAMSGYALRLAMAVRSRQLGFAPLNTGPVPQVLLAAQDFDTELRQALTLARVWPAARAAVDGMASGAQNSVVGTAGTRRF
ncbi:MAB_1171c family putative transporter [Nocardia brasiliensis]|uniref:DUF6545 domain-containing protein n=1 Tax=Nocardia brasiliensis (strain ATCC 700358 / HUJEG-1) TaxID=1133849 RepID=K0F464_NOCB7|nr:MAB_1171c family putative transporter [Nocardia brasiliensis]AFU04339.1 hypothetical protein O3I_031950 [Nocardia brasiliensis ATCC 700358]